MTTCPKNHHNSKLSEAFTSKSIIQKNLTGAVPYTLKNDYLFHIAMQENIKALTGLVSSLLHLDPKEIKELLVLNPIIPGKSIDLKFINLDIKVSLNNEQIINLELQVVNEHNWPDRSLYYLCQTFDELIHDKDYIDVKPVIHISILDFELFPEVPEFYATYMLLNVKNHYLYSNKLRLSALELNKVDIATDEDKQYQIDY